MPEDGLRTGRNM